MSMLIFFQKYILSCVFHFLFSKKGCFLERMLKSEFLFHTYRKWAWTILKKIMIFLLVFSTIFDHFAPIKAHEFEQSFLIWNQIHKIRRCIRSSSFQLLSNNLAIIYGTFTSTFKVYWPVYNKGARGVLDFENPEEK